MADHAFRDSGILADLEATQTRYSLRFSLPKFHLSHYYYPNKTDS